MFHPQANKRHPNLMDLTGQKFGRATVISLVPWTPKKRTEYICRCDCGTVWKVRGEHLRNAAIVSCGCMRREKILELANFIAFKYVFAMIRDSAERRNLFFGLSMAQVMNLTKCSCYYCGEEPKTIHQTKYGIYIWNGVDRLDSKLPYVPENCVSCCKICNRIKREYPLEIFLEKVRAIAKKHSDTQSDKIIANSKGVLPPSTSVAG